jgi:hypothetical protein
MKNDPNNVFVKGLNYEVEYFKNNDSAKWKEISFD